MPRSRSPGYETLPVFIVMQGLTMASFAFTSSNLGTLAMEHMAPIAGTASSVQGVVGTLGAAVDRLRHRPGSSTGPPFRSCRHRRLRGRRRSSSSSLTEPKRLFAPIRIDSGEEHPTCVPEDLG